MTDRKLPPALDTLLLAIIDAYPDAKRASRQKRLLLAKKALFGVEVKPGRPTLDDRRAILEMAQEELRLAWPELAYEIGQASARLRGTEPPEVPQPPRVRSKSHRRLGREASSTASVVYTEESAEDRLRKKYRETKLGQVAEFEEALERDAADHAIIEAILELLDRLGISSTALGRK